MSKEFIVAIELGSSKITGVAGRKNIDGSISVIKVVKLPTNGCIRKGVVYNIDKTESLLKDVVSKLSQSLGYEIKRVYVGAGGRSIRSVRNVVNKTFDVETVVTGEMVDELMDSNRNMQYPDQTIIGQETQEYKVDQQFQLDPVGIQCKKLEGYFLNILWRKTFERTFNKCFQDTGITIAELFLSPLVLAESVLTESERRNGCMLVDLGADTTTVATYYRNKLRHLAVIPLGSNNINKDLSTYQIDDAEAEEMKIKYASAFCEEQDINNEEELSIDGERSIKVKDFQLLVEARMEEIIRNAWFQVPSEYAEKLNGGIIITGGGSNMKNIEKAFQTHTKKNKVRIAHTVNHTIDSNHPDIKAQDGTMNTILALLSRGDLNCVGKELNNDFFSDEKQAQTTAEATEEEEEKREARDPKTLTPEVIQTEEERNLIEQERQRKIEEQQRQIEELKRQQEAEKKKAKEKSWFNKIKKRISKLASDIMEEEKDTN
ncbi:MAG: cell division protein FtsA [Bacteroidaceae bacterium]|nr:cell division protein FtsA [Bacteroidaceae bacterium]